VELSGEALTGFFETVLPHLNERQRRVVVGAMAEALGRGGQARVVEASSMSSSTIAKAVAEMRSGVELSDRQRARGGGDRPAIDKQPGLLDTLRQRRPTRPQSSCSIGPRPVAGPGRRRYLVAVTSTRTFRRLDLMAEHLGRDAGGDAELLDVWQAFDTCRATAEALDQWHEQGGIGPRPAGRLQAAPDPRPRRWTRAWSGLAYRRLYDPDGRRRIDRRDRRF
jgi:hypothetical protein